MASKTKKPVTKSAPQTINGLYINSVKTLLNILSYPELVGLLKTNPTFFTLYASLLGFVVKYEQEHDSAIKYANDLLSLAKKQFTNLSATEQLNFSKFNSTLTDLTQFVVKNTKVLSSDLEANNLKHIPLFLKDSSLLFDANKINPQHETELTKPSDLLEADYPFTSKPTIIPKLKLASAFICIALSILITIGWAILWANHQTFKDYWAIQNVGWVAFFEIFFSFLVYGSCAVNFCLFLFYRSSNSTTRDITKYSYSRLVAGLLIFFCVLQLVPSIYNTVWFVTQAPYTTTPIPQHWINFYTGYGITVTVLNVILIILLVAAMIKAPHIDQRKALKNMKKMIMSADDDEKLPPTSGTKQ